VRPTATQRIDDAVNTPFCTGFVGKMAV